jgi:hypothetical protein
MLWREPYSVGGGANESSGDLFLSMSRSVYVLKKIFAKKIIGSQI